MKLTGEDTLVFFMESKNIIAYRLSDGLKLWHIDLRELIPDVLTWYDDQSAAHDDKIFFYAKSEFESGFTFCLDTTTGHEIARFKEIRGDMRAFGDQLFASVETNTLVGLNMDTLLLSKWDFKKILAPVNLQINAFSFFVTENNLLCFADSRGFTSLRFGVVNIATNDVIQIENVAVCDHHKQNILEVFRYGKRVYIETSDKSLHLYRLEANT
ncbi:MAG: hypothetical protein ABWZ25_19490 [Chitinophagaceae bacterium]